MAYSCLFTKFFIWFKLCRMIALTFELIWLISDYDAKPSAHAAFICIFIVLSIDFLLKQQNLISYNNFEVNSAIIAIQ